MEFKFYFVPIIIITAITFTIYQLCTAYDSNDYVAKKWGLEYSVVAGFFAFLPMISDHLLDTIQSMNYFRCTVRHFLVFGYFITSAIMISYLTSRENISECFLLNLANLQLILVLSGILLEIKSACKYFHFDWKMGTALLSITFSVALSGYGITKRMSRLTLPINIMIIFLIVLSMVTFIERCGIWYFREIKQRNLSSLSTKEASCLVHIIFYLLLSISWIAIQFLSTMTELQNKQLQYILIVNTTTIACICVLMVQGRIVTAECSYYKQAYESQKAFCRTTAHEIRTPLNIVFLGSQLISKVITEIDQNNTELLDIVADVRESCDVAINLVSDFLTHDKLMDGMLRIEKMPINIWKLVKESVKPFFIQARESRIELIIEENCNLDSNELYIDGDKYKLSQVFRNLLSNALKFTPRKGKVRITATILSQPHFEKVPMILNTDTASTVHINNIPSGIKCVRSGKSNPLIQPEPTLERWLRISVIDTGAGISKENQCKLFKEIIQFSPGKLQGGKGSGLGMMITKGIIDLHGGYISVYSEGEGRGSTFHIDLPLLGIHTSGPSGDAKDTTGIADCLTRKGSNHSLMGSWIGVRSEVERSDMDEDRMSNIDDMIVGENEIALHTSHNTSHNTSFLSSHSALVNTAVMDWIQKPSFKFMSKPLSRGDSTTSSSSLNGKIRTRQSQATSGQLHFLVVDDAHLNRKMMCRSLRGRWDSVIEAEDGQEALNAVIQSMRRKKPFDVVLMDYNMPIMTGPAAAKCMREQGYDGVIIGVSGNVMQCDVDFFLSHGADQVLSKPVDVALLETVLAGMYPYFTVLPFL